MSNLRGAGRFNVGRELALVGGGVATGVASAGIAGGKLDGVGRKNGGRNLIGRFLMVTLPAVELFLRFGLAVDVL